MLLPVRRHQSPGRPRPDGLQPAPAPCTAAYRSAHAPGVVAGHFDELGQAEVVQAGREVIEIRPVRQDHVVRLDVTMKDAAFVGVLQRVGQRGEPLRRQWRRDRPALGLEPLAKCWPSAELRGDEVTRRAELSSAARRSVSRAVSRGCSASLTR